MPSLGSHLVRAHIVAGRLLLPEIEADRGAFYLGATAPDIRVITRKPREATHFYALDEFGEQDSVARMLEEWPGLATPSGLDAATTAFMAGYVTHLVLDESFIAEIYRPYFGAYSEIDGDPRSDILDRALQYEMDRRDREDEGVREAIQRAFAASAPVRGFPFIEDAHLEEWATVSEDVASQPADYSRFTRMMMRHLRTAGYDEATIEQECESPRELVREAFEIVTEPRVARFWEDVTDRMTERVRGYLR